MMKNNVFKILAIGFILLCLSACSNKADNISDSVNEKEDGAQEFTSISQLENETIGMLTGSMFDSIIPDMLPDAEYLYFQSYGDLVSALRSGKIDAWPSDYLTVLDTANEYDDLGYIDEVIINQECGFIFNRDENGFNLRQQVNEFLKEAEESGLKEDLYNKWVNDLNADMYDYKNLPGPNGTLRVSTSGSTNHISFIRDNKLVGYEVELLALFCEKYGYNFEYNLTDFTGMLSALASGKADIAFASLAYTEERAKNVYYSDVTLYSPGYFVVRKNNSATNTNLINSIVNSFYDTFIVEDRYKLFINGCLTTISITILSVIFGTLLGFVTYLKARNNDGIFNKFVDFMIWLIHGMPTVVLLMILFYVIFGNVSISGFVVAVICFSLTFACSMYSMLKGAENAIDKGQKEAAYTLGFNDSQTYYMIIFPQSITYFMPSYNAEIVSLIKATAVVGYIAVQDITKIADIVRSRTFEAFFPLVAIAIMYFIMAAILSAIVKHIDFEINPAKKDHTKFLKGVSLHD